MQSYRVEERTSHPEFWITRILGYLAAVIGAFYSGGLTLVCIPICEFMIAMNIRSAEDAVTKASIPNTHDFARAMHEAARRGQPNIKRVYDTNTGDDECGWVRHTWTAELRRD